VLKIIGSLVISLVFWAAFLLLFHNGVIPIDKQGAASNAGAWLSSTFIPSSLIVIGVTLLSSGIWFLISSKSQDDERCYEQVKYWWGLLMLPLATIGVVIFAYRAELKDAAAYILLSNILHVIWIYWIGTCLSSQNFAKYILPGSRKIRSIASSIGIPV
jgi:cytochrome bd-type quinol oxidase subunit 2